MVAAAFQDEESDLMKCVGGMGFKTSSVIIPSRSSRKLGMVPHACDPDTWEVEAESLP